MENGINADLRVVKPRRSANKKKQGVLCRFKGISPHRYGFQAGIAYNRRRVCFKVQRLDTEAALLYNYAAVLIRNDENKLNEIPETEMPTYERQLELYDIVTEKLAQLGLTVQV